MRIKRQVFVTRVANLIRVLGFTSLLVSPVAANAGSISSSGNACIPVWNSQPILHDNVGSLNDFTGWKDWFCPFSWGATTFICSSFTGAGLVFIDNYNGDNVSCKIVKASANGSIWFSATKWSCSTPGGCSSWTDQGYTGTSYLSWNQAELGASSFSCSNEGFTFRCIIPQKSADGNRSGVISYNMYY